MNNINNIIAQNLSVLMERQNVTQKELAEYMHVSQATISNWCKGVKLPRMDKIDKICTFFNISRSELMEKEDTPSKPKGVAIPIVGTIVAGLPADAYEEILGYEEVSPELARRGELICLKIRGHSMEPVLQEDDLVVIKYQPDIDSGDIAAVRINGDEATLKQVQKSKEGIVLNAFNPSVYPPHFYSNEEILNLPIEIIGKVIEMHRTF